MRENMLAEQIYMYCKNRWNYYENRDGVYLPSKHDKKVFEDASMKFGLTEIQCEEYFDMIDKPLAEQKVKDAVQSGKVLELCDEVISGNGENPWGIKRILGNFYSIISEINVDDLKYMYITVHKRNESNPSKEDCLLSLSLNKKISITKRDNGDIVISDSENSFAFDVENLISVTKGLPTPKGKRAFANRSFLVLLSNGNIVSVFMTFGS